MDGQKCENNHQLESINKKTVFLFKSPKDNEIDRYAETLEKAGIPSVSLPVLSFSFVNQSLLKSYMSAFHLFSAIIFTSVRAVEAVVNVMKELNIENFAHLESFVVGKATAEAARKANFNPKGEDTGHGEALADFILRQVKSDKSKTFLYPCSNIRRDNLKEMLTSNGLSVTEVIAYETCPNEELKNAIHGALAQLGVPNYAVFFSPSGFQYTLTVVDRDSLPLEKVKIIALGPATYKSICDLGYTPHGMAEKPDPDSLLQLLK
ncbi:unnamed protein product [Lymnaea stagnalis]|uniref:Uroporphyrinogen-III synthase n=1 Tax=Lymnaea stagnalis TaxID=6523 RepID=A0AAV2H027_LYMST